MTRLVITAVSTVIIGMIMLHFLKKEKKHPKRDWAIINNEFVELHRWEED